MRCCHDHTIASRVGLWAWYARQCRQWPKSGDIGNRPDTAFLGDGSVLVTPPSAVLWSRGPGTGAERWIPQSLGSVYSHEQASSWESVVTSVSSKTWAVAARKMFRAAASFSGCPAAKSSDGLGDVTGDLDRVPGAPEPGGHRLRTRRHHLGYRTPESCDPYGRAGPSHVLQDRQTCRFKLGNRDFSHIQF